jgi:hypothetical protein
MAQLLGQQSLASGEDAGDTQPPSLPPVVELLPGQPLEMASPQKGASQGSGPGRHSLRQREDLGKIPKLAEDEHLQHISPLAEEGHTPGPPTMDGRLNAT